MAFISRVIQDLLVRHPLHPLIVHFPVALSTVGLLFIILALWRRSDILEQIAFANLVLVAASAPVAAAVGIRDNLAFYNGIAPNHIVKIILASTLFIIALVMAIARWRNKNLFHSKSAKAVYVTAYFVNFVIAAVLGFLGAIIMYGF